jgi:hypothetical protein
MYQEFYDKSDLLTWPLVGLVIFIGLFLGVLGYVFIGLKNRDKVDEFSALPFVSETEVDGCTEGKAQNNE